MIVKFDHITYVASKKQFDERKINLDCIKFKEKNLKNPKGKQKFMYKKFINADLFYIEIGNKMPVEVILYDEVIGSSHTYMKDNTIYTYCKENSFYEIETVLDLIGLKIIEKKEKERIYKINGVFDKQEIFLHIKESQNSNPLFLDTGGWNCPCFLVDSVKKLFNKLAKASCICTSVDNLIVNGRALEIGFLKNESLSIILEFIAPIY